MLMKFLQFLFEQTIHVCYMYMQLFFEEEEGERERAYNIGHQYIYCSFIIIVIIMPLYDDSSTRLC